MEDDDRPRADEHESEDAEELGRRPLPDSLHTALPRSELTRPRGSLVPRRAPGTIRPVKVLLVSPDPSSRELMGLAVAGLSRRLGTEK